LRANATLRAQQSLARLIVFEPVGDNRHVERVFNPDRKDTHWSRRKLARDR